MRRVFLTDEFEWTGVDVYNRLSEGISCVDRFVVYLLSLPPFLNPVGLWVREG